jgi:hypothetical protein
VSASSICRSTCWVLCLALPAAQADASRTIYRCEIAGVITFSDRPCGSKIQAYEPEPGAFNSYEPLPSAPPPRGDAKVKPKVEPRDEATRRAAAARSKADARAARQAAECDRIADSLRDIRSRMRSGYSAEEGEQLEARQAKLQARRRAARCRS